MVLKILCIILVILNVHISCAKSNGILDKLIYLSYLDTLKVEAFMQSFNISQRHTQFDDLKKTLIHLCKANYFIARKKFDQAKEHIDFVEKKKYLLKRSNLLVFFYKLKIWTLAHSELDMQKLIKLGEKIQHYPIPVDLQIVFLNAFSSKYLFDNPVFASKMLNKAIDAGIYDSIPELYHTFLNLTTIFLAYSMVNEAQKILQIADNFKKLNNNPILPRLHENNKGLLLLLKGNVDNALMIFKNNLYYFRQYELWNYFFASAGNIYFAYSKKNEKDSAMKYLLLQRNMLKDFTNDSNIISLNYQIRFYLHLTENFLASNKWDSIYYYIRKSISLAEKNKQTDILYHLYDKLAQIFFLKKEIDSAFHYQKLAFDLFMKNFEQILQIVISDYSARFELINTTMKLQHLEHEKTIRELEQKRLRYLYAGSILILLALLLSMFSFLYAGYVKKVSKLREQYSEAITRTHEKALFDIATEIHDRVAGNLVTFYHAQKHKLETHHQQLISEAIETLRSLSHNLYPTHTLKSPLTHILKNLIVAHENMGTLHCVFHHHENIDSLITHEETKFHIYRIIQELLTNTIKYADRKIVMIQIKITKNNIVTIEYKDHQLLRRKHIKPGLGLMAINTRVKMLDGKWKYSFRKGFRAIMQFKISSV